MPPPEIDTGVVKQYLLRLRRRKTMTVIPRIDAPRRLALPAVNGKTVLAIIRQSIHGRNAPTATGAQIRVRRWISRENSFCAPYVSLRMQWHLTMTTPSAIGYTMWRMRK